MFVGKHRVPASTSSTQPRSAFGEPPTNVPLFEGFDGNYRDDAGRRVGDMGFVPPCYDDRYRDAKGRRPGQAGFESPRTEPDVHLAWRARWHALQNLCTQKKE